MVKQYSLVEKKRALNLLSELNLKGQVKVDKKVITNVRDLSKALNITVNSLYRWRKEITLKKKKAPGVKKKRKGTIRHEKFKAEQAELLKQKEARIQIKALEKELSKLNQLTGREDPKVKQKIRETVKKITKIEKEVKERKAEILGLSEEELAMVQLGKGSTFLEEREREIIIPSDSGVFGNRFAGYIAQQAKIPNYSRMRLKQLLFKVGMAYINKSGRKLKEGK